MTSFSIIGMFLQADIIVQIVAIILILMSIYSWSIIIMKTLSVGTNTNEVKDFGARINSNEDTTVSQKIQMAESNKYNSLSKVIISMGDELKRSKNLDVKSNKESILLRLQKISDTSIEELLNSVQSGYTVLGTIGATSPFIGLFGTVWGIMSSFEHISKTQTTGLSVVAPGIAEALFVTALGLVVAIPAVIFYNRINRKVGLFETELAKYTDIALNDFSYNLDLISEPKS